MIKCARCNEEINIIELSNGNLIELQQCSSGCLYFQTRYGVFINQEQIKCPKCKKYPFDNDIEDITHYTRVLIKRGEL